MLTADVDNEKLQDLFYTFDPAGNIVSIHDQAQQSIFFNGQVVKPDADYTYDSIYRLIKAVGREHMGNVLQPQSSWNDEFRIGLAHPHDGQKMRSYLEAYEYDGVGNILSLNHMVPDPHNMNNWTPNWIREYKYEESSLTEIGKYSNRLSHTVVHPNAQQPIVEPYTYDQHGNMISMPHLKNMDFDFNDQLKKVDLGGGGIEYYIYDSAGQRIRKVHKHIGALLEERIYLGNYEVYRKYNGNGLKLERETLHFMDDKQRIALVDTRTIDNTGGSDPAPAELVRYQLSNHLGSTSLELDEQAQIISYEEYTPYGSTSYQALHQVETPKRYRFTAKERDEETGFSYNGARYYAPWLGRWMNCDPTGLKDGVNHYVYVGSNPICLIDPAGTDGREPNIAQMERRLKEINAEIAEQEAIVAKYDKVDAAKAELVKRGEDVKKFKAQIIDVRTKIAKDLNNIDLMEKEAKAREVWEEEHNWLYKLFTSYETYNKYRAARENMLNHPEWRVTPTIDLTNQIVLASQSDDVQVYKGQSLAGLPEV